MNLSAVSIWHGSLSSDFDDLMIAMVVEIVMPVVIVMVVKVMQGTTCAYGAFAILLLLSFEQPLVKCDGESAA